MNIVQALEWSRKSGLSVSRTNCEGFPGWIRYGDDFVFKLSGRDMLAEDWEPSANVIAEITNGQWEYVEVPGIASSIRE